MEVHLDVDQKLHVHDQVFFIYFQVIINIEIVSARPSSAKVLRVKCMNLNNQPKVLIYHNTGTGRDTYIS